MQTRPLRPIAAFLILILFGLPLAAGAQEAIVRTAAPIFLFPDASRVPLRTAATGTTLKVLEEKNSWVKVEFNDPQFGVRVGYIEARHIEIRRPELEPTDLSIRKEPVRPVDVAEPPASPESQPDVSRPRGFARGWIDVNVGFALAAKSRYGSVFEDIRFREPATFTVDYHSPPGAEFDFGGGVMITPAFGIGVSFAGTAHQDNAELGISIPHPFFFNAHASDSAPTEGKLTRSEGSANIQAVFVNHVSDRLTTRIYGGPSFFRVRQETVSNIVYDQDFLVFSPVNVVDITEYETTVISYEEATGWGFHVGGDVNIFFTRVVGIGWFAKYSRGTVDFLDPFASAEGELKTGGFQTGGGLRLRF